MLYTFQGLVERRTCSSILEAIDRKGNVSNTTGDSRVRNKCIRTSIFTKHPSLSCSLLRRHLFAKACA